MRVHAEVCHDNGIASVHYSPQGYCLYTGGEKGEIGMFDLRMMRMVEVSLRPNCPPQRRLDAEILALRVSDIPSARVGGAVHQRFEGSAAHLHGLERRHAQGAQSICFPLLGWL